MLNKSFTGYHPRGRLPRGRLLNLSKGTYFCQKFFQRRITRRPIAGSEQALRNHELVESPCLSSETDRTVEVLRD